MNSALSCLSDSRHYLPMLLLVCLPMLSPFLALFPCSRIQCTPKQMFRKHWTGRRKQIPNAPTAAADPRNSEANASKTLGGMTKTHSDIPFAAATHKKPDPWYSEARLRKPQAERRSRCSDSPQLGLHHPLSPFLWNDTEGKHLPTDTVDAVRKLSKPV